MTDTGADTASSARTDENPGGWRWRPGVAAVCLGLFLLVQLVIPVSSLGESQRARRFAWQMFAYHTQVEFTVDTAEGPVMVPLESILARPRGDLPLEETVPPHLCLVIPGAVAVRWAGGEWRC
ncbi:MAG: hypothetical protein L0Z63_02405 [Actinobacteria bacterium]|nr:hypothetical protein [Actinomycetota bacterium]